ncbi:CHC2 zinc finger domain-containing protein [Nocardia terpenica]|uniref:CHC2 zinc finger domain-containing protein n=1 Tax=Nocardia terpenica TaxID=455432 RepID=UPI0035A07A8B
MPDRSGGRSAGEGRALITQVIHRYCPDWVPPDAGRNEWVSCRCPFHGDDSPSASVSYASSAFKCFACPVKGDAIAIIRQQEEVSFAEAVRIAEDLSPDGGRTVRQKPARKPGRRVFGDTGPDGSERPRDRQRLRPGIRGRSTPWS